VHPVLFYIGDVAVKSYGTFLCVAFLCGIALALRRAPGLGLDREVVIEVSIVIILTSLLGAKALWWLTHPAADPLRSPLSGLSVLGGVALATAATFAYARVRRVPALALADGLAPSVLLGAGITRIGCFLNGCCHGIPCDWPWAIRLPGGIATLHPTQLYASALAFAGCAALLAWARRKPAAGSLFWAFLLIVGGVRLGLEPLRQADPGSVRELAGVALSGNRLAALGMGLLGAVGLGLTHKRRSSE
jgi:phosphatidylglycerol---prolipoprotein diacylglyceryl transferase